jgi:hypothetical protein
MMAEVRMAPEQKTIVSRLETIELMVIQELKEGFRKEAGVFGMWLSKRMSGMLGAKW